MSIHKLPQYLINKLKAGEVVERPASSVKEILENSLDAGADELILEIINGGKTLIKLQDNGTGITHSDLDLTIERYATSKITKEEDLRTIGTYGFRGEALASVAEVSKFRIQTKTVDSVTGFELSKINQDVNVKQVPLNFEHGTIVYIEDLFFNTPVRQKFLKSAQTEWGYIYSIFLDFAIIHFDKHFTIKKDGKGFLDLPKQQSIVDRIFDIYKKDWQNNLKFIEKSEGGIHLSGLVSDSLLSFGSPDNIKIFVNKRPVTDKVIKKSIISAYERQIPYGEYPFAIMFLELNPDLVDVNVHPRKTEVKFLDPGTIFNFVKFSIVDAFSETKISKGTFISPEINSFSKPIQNLQNSFFQQNLINKTESGFFQQNSFHDNNVSNEVMSPIGRFEILGQLWDSYILLQGENSLYFADEHALAERISFEKMKSNIDLNPEILLNPLTIEISKNIDISAQLEQLNKLGFDVSMFGENKLIVYSMPRVLANNQIDLDKIINKIIYLEKIDLDVIFDNIWATKACKTSIKAGQKLSMNEMQNLIKDSFAYIPNLFVCQHGRPSFVEISKENISKLFDRK